MPNRNKSIVAATAYPQAVREIIAEMDDEPKDRPKQFIGRRTEVDRIMRTVHSSIPTKRRQGVPRRKIGFQEAVLRIITGGPGAGKTSLLKEVEAKCRHHKCRVIRLHVEDLASPENLTNAIRKACHWRGKETLQTLGREVASTTATATDSIIGGWIRFGAQLAGLLVADTTQELDAETIEPARAVLRCWQGDEPANPQDVLVLLSRLGPTVITMDEAHLLDRYLSEDSSATAPTVIRTLATPEARADAKVGRCIMIVAGLNDLHPTITRLGTFRQNPLQLGAFTGTDTEEVIASWIDRATADSAVKEQAKQHWLPVLSVEFGQWPHHAIGAGMGARAVLDTGGPEAVMTEWGIAAVREVAENYRRRLYGYVAGLAQDEGVPLDPAMAVALSLPDGGGNVSIRRVLMLTGLALKFEQEDRDATGQTAKLPTPEDAVKRMMRAGILEYADIDGTDRMPSHLRMAIPSLGAYLRAVPRDRNSPAERAVAEAARV